MKSEIFGSKAIKIINELQKKGIINDYVIAGGVATIFYTEPFFTYDLDIIFNTNKKGLDILSPIYNYLKKKGYKLDKEHVIIEGTPVQFLPVYNDLINEALQNAVPIMIDNCKTKVMKAEYLIAIFLQVFRPKDKIKLIKIIDQGNIDKNILEKILTKYNLKKQYQNFINKYYD